MTTAPLRAMPTLTTRRLLLSPLTQGDADALFALLRDPAVTRYLDLDALEQRAQAVDLLDEFLRRLARGEEQRWAVRLHSGASIGLVSLDLRSRVRGRAELGYALAAAYWRRGFATEAIRAVLEHGFGTLGLNRIEAMVYAENTASRALLTRLGFVEEGRLRQHAWEHGRYWDDIIYGLLADEYAAPAAHSTPAGG